MVNLLRLKIVKLIIMQPLFGYNYAQKRTYNGDGFNDVKDIANECSISNNSNLCRARH